VTTAAAIDAGSLRADEVLTPYVPVLLIDWLRESPAARYREIDASLAFVDISGFTTLTERLARTGKEGSEEISDTLDDCFTQLLDVAYDYGAGVVKWGGDAVVILFEGPDHAARACCAATGMQRTIRRIGRLQTSAGRVVLRMSVGIHSGTFHFFLTGGLHRELILTGPGADKTVAMQSIATAGEIVVSRDTSSLLDAGVLGPPRDGGCLLKRAPAAHPQHSGAAPDTSGLPLGSCISAEIRDHILAGWREPEHRLVTTGFVEFSGTTELLERSGPIAVADALDECMQNVEDAAHRHEVSFFDTDVYKRGGKILLVAGCPRSTGNNEERMLRTLRRVLDDAGELPLRAGVSTGRVFADDFGPPYRRTYSVKGDSVNLAARLMANARSGQVLATESTLAGSRARFELERVEPLRVKGKSHPVRAAGVGPLLTSRVAVAAARPLVGRERELNELLAALEGARRGEGRLVEIVAAAGMGKSRLLEELRARAGDAHVVAAVGDEYEASTAYFPFRALLRELLGVDRLDDRKAARQLGTRVAAVTPHLRPWLPLLAIPLELDVAGTPETNRLDERFRRTKLEEATSELLGTILQEPTVFTFEDVQWLDEASAALLRRLAQDASRRPWLVVTTRRPVEGESAASTLLGLEPLAPEAATHLVHAATEDRPLPAHQVRALVERAGGNPLFLVELVEAASASEELPDSLETLVAAHIDRLAPGDRMLLRYASVLGRSFDERLLVASLNGSATPPDEAAWRRLSDFLVRDEAGVIHFRQSVIRDTAYEGLPFRRRRELHARIGDAIVAAGDSDHHAERLSLHFLNAQRFEAAWRYSRIAGDRARSIYATAEAADLYRRALEAARSLRSIPAAELAEVYEALGDATERLGLFRQSATAYREARRHRAGDLAAVAGLMLKEGWIPEREGRYPAALRWFRRGLSLLDGTEGPEADARRAQLMAGYATVRQMQGRSSQTVEWCRAAIAAAERAGERRALAHAYHTLDWAHVELGRPEEAVFSPQALAIYEELDDLGNQAVVQNAMAAFAYYAGRWNEAVELNERAVSALEAVGDPVRRADCVFNIAEIRCDQGRLDEAQLFLEDALRAWKAAGFRARLALGTRLQGVLALRAGRLDEALALFEEARAGFTEVGAQSEVTATDGRIVECLLLRGDVARARLLATEAVDRARSLGPVSLHLPMLQRLLGSSLFQAGDEAGARSLLEESLQAARARHARYDVALTLEALAQIARAEPERTAALEAERDEILAGLGVVVPPAAPPAIEYA
jgi:class 3 adenylate cyclase/tetratricopeptide (TPR) repeat protein